MPRVVRREDTACSPGRRYALSSRSRQIDYNSCMKVTKLAVRPRRRRVGRRYPEAGTARHCRRPARGSVLGHGAKTNEVSRSCTFYFAVWPPAPRRIIPASPGSCSLQFRLACLESESSRDTRSRVWSCTRIFILMHGVSAPRR